MLSILSENLGSIALVVVLASVLALVIIKMVRDKKRGKHSCSACSCSTCSMRGECHKK